LKGRAAARGLTPSAVVLAAYCRGASPVGAADPRLHRERHNVSATAVSSRRRARGRQLYVRPLVAYDRSGRRNFAERAAAVQAELWKGLEHHHFGGVGSDPGARTERRRGGLSPVMPVVFTSLLGEGEVGAARFGAGATASGFEPVYGVSQTVAGVARPAGV